MTEDNSKGYLISHSLWLKIRKPFLSAVIILHLGLIIGWLFPLRSGAIDPPEVVRGLYNYFLFIGMDQDWRVFAPKPRDTNLHLVAVVKHKDGSLEMWEYPRLERMGFVERLYKERFRKFAHDNVAWEKFSMFQPDLARFIARATNTQPGNPPVFVSLVRFSAPIPVPPAGFHENLPPEFETKTIISYQVQDEDLK